MTITADTNHETYRHHLVRGHDAGGQRFFLAGRPVHAGYWLELLVDADIWLGGRYETARDKDDNIQALFCVLLPHSPASTLGAFIELKLPPTACLRWPDEP